MSGVDWDAVWQRYLPLSTASRTRAELSDLVWEMQGELGTSHAYEMGGDHRAGPHYRSATSAPTSRWIAAGGYEIDRIVRGDPWDAGADSPLNARRRSAGRRAHRRGRRPAASRRAPPHDDCS